LYFFSSMKEKHRQRNLPRHPMTTAVDKEFIHLVGYGPLKTHEQFSRLKEFFRENPWYTDPPMEAPLATAIQHRCTTEVLRFLLDKGCVVDKKGVGGHTPLSLAVRSKRDDLVDLLLARGANHAKRSGNVSTPPIVFAAQHSDIRVLQRLLQHDPHQINWTDRNRVSALRSAAKYGKTEAVRLLLAYGADPTLADQKGCTALAMCRSNAFFPAYSTRMESVETILKNRQPITLLLEEEDRAYHVFKGYAIADAHLVVEHEYPHNLFSILHLPDVLKKRICRGKVLPQVVYTAQGYRTHPASPVVIHRATIVQEVLYEVWAKLTHDVFGDLMGYLV